MTANHQCGFHKVAYIIIMCVKSTKLILVLELAVVSLKACQKAKIYLKKKGGDC